MIKKPAPFNQHEVENQVIARIAKQSHTSEENVRRLVKDENAEVCDELEDQVRIARLANRFPNVKICPTCGGSVN